MRAYLLALLASLVYAEEEISDCLKRCIAPMAKMERSFHHVFNNFEKVCDNLERGAHCVRKCENDDQRKFHQYTTFYRIHCVDYEEDLEPHVSCLAEAAKESDAVCQDQCRNAYKLSGNATKEEKASTSCLTLECSTVCYFDEFVEQCPDAKDVLLKLNLGQVHSITNSLHPNTISAMSEECKNIHDMDYMRTKMLAGPVV